MPLNTVNNALRKKKKNKLRKKSMFRFYWVHEEDFRILVSLHFDTVISNKEWFNSLQYFEAFKASKCLLILFPEGARYQTSKYFRQSLNHWWVSAVMLRSIYSGKVKNTWERISKLAQLPHQPQHHEAQLKPAAWIFTQCLDPVLQPMLDAKRPLLNCRQCGL